MPGDPLRVYDLAGFCVADRRCNRHSQSRAALAQPSPERRGATLAVHSTLGYAGGFIGPLAIGWTLDLSGGMSRFGWGMAFLVVAILVLLSLIAFLAMRPVGLAGDRGNPTQK